MTSENSEASSLLLEAKGITKRFGALVANDAVHLSIASGEIHALLGENGAGKSTFVKMLYGSLRPDEGTLLWKNNVVNIKSPAMARGLGIGMVFQHFSLFEALSVEENILLALPPEQSKDLKQRIKTVSAEYGLPLDPAATIADLSVGERQRVEIIRCLLQDPALIIMDEPTSVLTPQEADELFIVLEKLAGEGRSILYISHRLDEVKRLCHRATILRQGKLISQCDPTKETAKSLAALMVGNEVADVRRELQDREHLKKRLTVRSLNLPSQIATGTDLKDVAFDVAQGEILCIAGIAGNGQSELFAALSGETTAADVGSIVFDGWPCATAGITERRRRGAAFVPEERNGHAALADMRLSKNILLSWNNPGDGTTRRGIIKRMALARLEGVIAEAFDVRMAHADVEAGALSGGNLQKFVVGREVKRSPKLLVISQPTWGVDAGAASLIRQKLIDLSRRGTSIVVISQDLDEIFEIADRIAVISQGALSDVHAVDEITREQVGLLMGGMKLEKALLQGSASEPESPEVLYAV
ncbi:MAG: ABC transporter ATP-binding protein [Hyphomicrobiales bacterium]